MDVTAILDQLNPPQREAVSAEAKPTLVLAGAGSGKTRVLVHRIAWLLQVENVSPFGILAVTFTNKTAAEMRGRVERLMGGSAGGMWIGTFHSIAHRLLRQHWREAGLPQAFQILDSEDQYRLIRRVLKSLELDESRYPPRQAQWFINSRKDDGLRAKNIPDSDDPVPAQPAQGIPRLRRGLRTRRHGRLRGTPAARPRAVAQEPEPAGTLPAALPPHPGGRVPGHQRDPVRFGAHAGWRDRRALRGGRRRPVHLCLAWRQDRATSCASRRISPAPG